jgi:hypothetical protein
LIFVLVSFSPISCWTLGLKKTDPHWFQHLHEESEAKIRNELCRGQLIYRATPIYGDDSLVKWVSMTRMTKVLSYNKSNIKYYLRQTVQKTSSVNTSFFCSM